MSGIVVWTPKRVERLRRLAAEGLSAREIAKRLSPTYYRLTPSGVRNAASGRDILLLARGGRPKRKGCKP